VKGRHKYRGVTGAGGVDERTRRKSEIGTNASYWAKNFRAILAHSFEEDSLNGEG